jgi:uncharacterized membrane protein YkvI
MIQRLQTVFLFFITLLFLIMPFFDIWVKLDSTNVKHVIRPCTLQTVTDGKATIIATFPYTYISIGGAVIALLALYQISQYKNRRRQINIGALNSWLIIGLVSYMLYLTFTYNYKVDPGINGSYRIGYVIPVIALFLNSISTRLIKRDEVLVNSSNMLR